MGTRDAAPRVQDHVALRLSNALVLSLLLHAAAVGLLGLSRQLGEAVPRPEPLLDVDVITLPPPAPAAPPVAAPAPAAAPAPEKSLPHAQIVVPPDAGKAEPPKETRLLSDRDNTVAQQMVRRGEPEAATAAAPPEPPPAPAKAVRAPKPPARAEAATAKPSVPEQVARAPALDDLLPSAGQLAREGYADTDADEPPRDADPAVAQRQNVLRYADALGSSSGRRGTFDFLPDVREGDVTLLNTKAALFAPFVRRVAQRVFQNQFISLRRDLSWVRANVQEAAAVEAVMNQRGQILSVRIIEQSATSATGVDRHLIRACQQAFFDLNPPPGAESADGNIHFVFRTEMHGANYGALLMAGLL